MAMYDTLPVFKKSYDLTIEIYKMASCLSREYKYTIGEKLKNTSLELLLQIYNANSAVKKEAHIDKCREKVETARLLIRLLCDLRQISIKKMAALNTLIESIGRQLTGWKRSAGRSAVSAPAAVNE
jgi:hypothetical protein